MMEVNEFLEYMDSGKSVVAIQKYMNVVLAAGAVVTKDVAENAVVGGVPAKVIKNIEKEEE